jgi:hypothetical protein
MKITIELNYNEKIKASFIKHLIKGILFISGSLEVWLIMASDGKKIPLLLMEEKYFAELFD